MLMFWISKNVFHMPWKKTYLTGKVIYESSTSYDEYVVSIILSKILHLSLKSSLFERQVRREKEKLWILPNAQVPFSDFLSLSLIKLENDSNSTRRMAAPPRQHSGGGRTTSLRGDTSESDKLDPTASWDALEWTKIEVPSQFLSNSRVSSHSLSLSLSSLSHSLYFGLLFLIEILFLFLPIRIISFHSPIRGTFLMWNSISCSKTNKS